MPKSKEYYKEHFAHFTPGFALVVRRSEGEGGYAIYLFENYPDNDALRTALLTKKGQRIEYFKDRKTAERFVTRATNTADRQYLKTLTEDELRDAFYTKITIDTGYFERIDSKTDDFSAFSEGFDHVRILSDNGNHFFWRIGTPKLIRVFLPNFKF